jgi:hypothetical protein
MYTVRPMQLSRIARLEKYFPNPDALVFVQGVNLVLLMALCLGLVYHPAIRAKASLHFRILERLTSHSTRGNTHRLAIILGVIANFVFWTSVFYSGGPLRVFANRKPFLISPFKSGYIDELSLFSFPAILLLAVAYQGRQLRSSTVLTALAIASPHLVMGTIGGRRGPAFLILATLVIGYIIVRQRAPSYKRVAIGLGFVGAFLLALNLHRGDLFRTSLLDVISSTITSSFSSQTVNSGDEFVAAAATILTAEHHARFYWGRRYITWFLVRPIPSFLWPTKYIDMGMDWMVWRPGTAGFETHEWHQAIGFEPAGGSAGGFISDLFLEFSWLAVIPAFLVGRSFSLVWYRSLTLGGVWTIFYFEMLILSIYLTTQNIEAWLYRLILLGMASLLFWRITVHQSSLRRTRRSTGWGSIQRI